MDEREIGQLVKLVPIERYIPSLGERARDAAIRLLRETGSLEGLSGPQQRALILVQELDVLNAVEFELNVAMGHVLVEIEDDELAGYHPSDMYRTVSDIAVEFGMAKSETSDLTTLVRVVIPYLLEMGLNPRDVWRRIGKAKMRMIIPHIRCVAGDEAGRRPAKRIRGQVEKIQQKIVDIYREMGEDPPDDMTRATVEFLLDAAENFTWADLSRVISDPRGEETVAFYFRNLGKGTLQVEPTLYSKDQVDLIRRRMGPYGEIFIEDGGEIIDAKPRA